MSILGPVTSTPYVRKRPAVASQQPPVKSKPKGRKTVGDYDVKVSVHDGIAMRSVSISTKDALLDLLEKIAELMKRPNHMVQMAYKAPWSSKVGTKKISTYITTDGELDDFWLAYHGHVTKIASKAVAGKKPKVTEVTVVGIVFRNMNDDAAQASLSTVRGPFVLTFS